MKRLLHVCILTVMMTGGAQSVDRMKDMKALSVAYEEYKAAVESEDLELAAAKAETAWLAGKKVYPVNDDTMIQLTFNYAEALKGLENDPEAGKVLDSYVQDLIALPDQGGMKTIDVLFKQADLFNWIFNYDGRRAFRKAVTQAKKIWDKDSEDLGRVYLRAGEKAVNNPRAIGATNYLNKARKIFEKRNNTKLLARTNFYIGKYNLGFRKYRKAIKNLNKSLALVENESPGEKFTLTIHATLVEAYEKLGKPGEATKHCLAIGKAQEGTELLGMEPVYRPFARYPNAMLKKGIQGSALVRFTVDENGFVRDPELLEVEGGEAFGKVALTAIENYRYAPRYENGIPVSTHNVKYSFGFEIAH